LTHHATTRFLRRSRANRVILQCTDAGHYEASAHKIFLRMYYVEAPSRDAALASLDALLEQAYPEPTIPTNELPDEQPPATDRRPEAEVSNV
jgi:hypothetical protein